ncbi:VMAP-C domain-containing protein [Streptomyces sp. NBC_01198]|uniref:VMAP-C domain-containing protein n=1 Tax=Streptomyces sp. NBC_01198 TaxID=2903769 RepID=UPI002E113A24|nr:caspase family protein [Streptomyces sp. NBC_01198]
MTSAEPVPDVDPSRMYALVVGIEDYAVGPDWRLPGAVADAVGFATWLTRPGQVPVRNVRLFLSPDARTGGQPELGPLTSRPPTENDIYDAAVDDLPACDGDLLWIFWAGHGFLNERNEALLPCGDATARNMHHCNLQSLLRFWESDMVDRGRFPSQVAISDTCRVDRRRNNRLRWPVRDPPFSGKVPGRRQFVLYAAGEGETARNMRDRSAGMFTHTLLEQLETMTVAESVPVLVETARRVQGTLAALRGQRPQFVINRNWDGSSLFGDHWDTATGTDGPAPDGSPALDQVGWNQLGPLVVGRALPAYAFEAYQWAFKQAECALPATPGLPDDELTEVVRVLDGYQGRHGASLALLFLRHVAAHADDRPWGDALDAWVDVTRERLGARPIPPAPVRPAPAPTLYVRLTESALPGAFLTHVWRSDDDGAFEPVWRSDTALGLDAVRGRLSGLLDASAAGVGRPGVARLVFSVPYGLLTEEFENWAVAGGRSPYLLGHRHAVLVCSPAERDGTLAQWRERWQWLQSNRGGSWQPFTADADTPRRPVLVLQADAVPQRLGDQLQADRLPVCLLVEGGRQDTDTALNAALDAGVPVAVWRRGGPPRTRSADGGLVAALTGDSPWLDLKALPDRLRRLRLEGSAASSQQQSWRHPLAVLWDEPDSEPESPRRLG